MSAAINRLILPQIKSLVISFIVISGICCESREVSNENSASMRPDTLSALIDSTKAFYYFDTALILQKKKIYRESTMFFDLAVHSGYPDVHEAHHQMGNNFYNEGIFSMAIFEYNQAIQNNPKKDYRSFYNRAYAKYYLGMHQSVICPDVDSAIAYGDTSNIIELCKEKR